MSAELQKQWEITKSFLAKAGDQVASCAGYAEYLDYLEHNELGLALDVLEGLGVTNPVTPEYWWQLLHAANLMELKTHCSSIQGRLEALGMSANNSLQARRP